jgi:uncharacterized repeat protein (TIGR01451 family)
MWRKLALCVGLPLVLLGVVAAATNGVLADMPEAPGEAQGSARARALALPPALDAGTLSSNVQPPSATQEVTFTQGVDGYAGCEDTHISAESSDQNLADEEELVLGGRGQVGVLMRFDVSQIPAECLVEEAKLQLQVVNWSVPHDEPSINASYSVTRPWVVTEATWYHATATDRWGQAGCNDVTSDRSGVELSRQALFDRDQWYTWDVTAAVQRWVDAPASNQGLYIRQVPTNTHVGGEYDIASCDWPSPDKRPRLIVRYRCEPDIEVRKELASPSGGIATVGEGIAFALHIQNTGATPITQLTVSDTYDSDYLSFVDASEPPDEQAPGLLTWNTLDAYLPLARGEELVLTVNFVAKAPTDFTTDTVSAEGVDSYGQHAGPKTDDAVVTIVAPPSIAVSKEPQAATIGLCETVVFTLRVTNTGMTAIDQCTVSDAYDDDFLSFVGSSEEPDGQVPGLITWNTLDTFLPLGPGESFAFTVEFEGKAVTAGTTNTVTAEGVDEYGQPAGPETDDAVVTIEPRPPGLAVTKEPPSTTATISEGVAFTLNIRNTGTTAITQLTVTDQYDSNFLSFVDASPEPDEQAPGVITWNTLDAFLPLAPGETFVLTVDFEAVQETEATINTVSAEGVDECDQPVGPVEDDAVVQIVSPYFLYIPKVIKCTCRQETYCSAPGDPIFRIDREDFPPYLCEPDEHGLISASLCPLEHVGGVAPSAWNQWDFDDSSWLPGRTVDWPVWVEGVKDETGKVIFKPAPPPADSEIIGLHLNSNDPDAEDEGIDEMTHLYRREFNLQPPAEGLLITSAVLKMWSDNKSEWWWHRQDQPGVAPQSIAYDDQFEIEEFVLFPSPDGFDYIDSSGGEYLLAIQNSNDRQTALGNPADPGLNPHGTAFCLVVNWGPCNCPPQIVQWLGD